MIGRRNNYFWLSVIWAIAILVVLTISPGQTVIEGTQYFPGIDKIVHFLLFAILFTLIAKATEKSFRNVSKWAILAGVCTYSLLTEVIQIFLEDRSFEFPDIIANIMGALVAFLFYNRK